METPVYLLIYRTPYKSITTPGTVYTTMERAGRAAGLVLYDNASVPRSTAQKHGDKIASRPVGSVYVHDSGYDFRILRADHTANGIPITPGLRVVNNDLKWGTVGRAQFMAEGASNPGGEHFLSWYDVDVDGHGRKPFDGGRLTTDGSGFGLIDVPRGTPAEGGPDDWTGRALGRARLLDNPPVVRTDGSPG